jgi:hypothetical protein
MSSYMVSETLTKSNYRYMQHVVKIVPVTIERFLERLPLNHPSPEFAKAGGVT